MFPVPVGVSTNAVQRRIASTLWSSQLIRLTNTFGGGAMRPASSSLFIFSNVRVIDAEVNSASEQTLTPAFYKRDGMPLPIRPARRSRFQISRASRFAAAAQMQILSTQPDAIDQDAERQLIATNLWQPSTGDLQQIIGRAA